MKKQTDMQERTLYFDVLRILASVFVMLLHISAKKWSKADVTSLEWGVMNVGDSISRWGVPVFTMISGALFLDRSDSIQTIFRKNIAKIAVTFAFWSALYAGASYVQHRDVEKLIADLLQGHYHLWYLYMIAGMYMIVPFLRAIVKDRRLTWYFLMLGLLFAFFIPQTKSVLSLFNAGAADLLQEVTDQFHMKLVLGYSVYYILGHVIHRYGLSRLQEKLVMAAGAAGFAVTIVFSAAASLYKGAPVKVFYHNFTVNVLLESVFVFVVVKKYMAGRQLSPCAGKAVASLSKLTMGAYLIHVLLIEVLDIVFHIDPTTGNPVLAIPLIWLGIALASFLVSWILHQIPVVKKWLV